MDPQDKNPLGGIKVSDLNELGKISHDILLEKREGDAKEFLGADEEFLQLVAQALGDIGVWYDFDVARGTVYVQAKNDSERLRIGTLLYFKRELDKQDNIDYQRYAEGLAAAIKAGLRAPEFFEFWKDDQFDDDDEE